jgi:hypothetical protein
MGAEPVAMKASFRCRIPSDSVCSALKRAAGGGTGASDILRFQPDGGFPSVKRYIHRRVRDCFRLLMWMSIGIGPVDAPFVIGKSTPRKTHEDTDHATTDGNRAAVQHWCLFAGTDNL